MYLETLSWKVDEISERVCFCVHTMIPAAETELLCLTGPAAAAVTIGSLVFLSISLQVFYSSSTLAPCVDSLPAPQTPSHLPLQSKQRGKPWKPGKKIKDSVVMCSCDRVANRVIGCAQETARDKKKRFLTV